MQIWLKMKEILQSADLQLAQAWHYNNSELPYLRVLYRFGL